MQEDMQWLTISKDGTQILNKNGFKSNNVSYYEGDAGRAKRLADSSFILPWNIQKGGGNLKVLQVL
jgi:hypothetical protein